MAWVLAARSSVRGLKAAVAAAPAALLLGAAAPALA